MIIDVLTIFIVCGLCWFVYKNRKEIKELKSIREDDDEIIEDVDDPYRTKDDFKPKHK